MTRVRLDTRGLDRLLDRARHQGVAAAARAVEAEARAIVDRARAEWGVRTGRGRRSLDVHVELRGGAFRVVVTSNDPTVRYHRPSGSRRTYWETLIDTPLRQRRMAEVAAQALVREVRRG